ncbi:MAG: amidohydrolase family protein [Acidimicrobiales bacterium]
MFIDVHNHVMSRETLDLLASEPSYGVTVDNDEWRGVHHVPFPIVASFYDPAARMRQMEEGGVDAAVISAPPPLFFYDVPTDAALRLCEVANEGMAKYCQHRPDRLRWLATLPMQDPDRAVELYRGAMSAGCVGAAIGTSIHGRRLDEPEFERFWATAEELGRPVLIHPAFNEAHAALAPYYLQNVIGNPLETTVMVERMICAGVFQRHPGIRLVLLHGGGYLPYQAGRLQHARGVRPELSDCPTDIWGTFKQLYFDTITHDVEALRYMLSRVGIANVVLGTDMPYDMAMQTPLATLREAFDEATIQRIAAENPAGLFGPFGEEAGGSAQR